MKYKRVETFRTWFMGSFPEDYPTLAEAQERVEELIGVGEQPGDMWIEPTSYFVIEPCEYEAIEQAQAAAKGEQDAKAEALEDAIDDIDAEAHEESDDDEAAD